MILLHARVIKAALHAPASQHAERTQCRPLLRPILRTRTDASSPSKRCPPHASSRLLSADHCCRLSCPVTCAAGGHASRHPADCRAHLRFLSACTASTIAGKAGGGAGAGGADAGSHGVRAVRAGGAAGQQLLPASAGGQCPGQSECGPYWLRWVQQGPRAYPSAGLLTPKSCLNPKP